MLEVALTLSNILSLAVFREADARVVAGAERLDREVRWVHIGEVPDIHDFVKGGELLLTSGLSLSMSDAELERYVDDLHKVGIAGVALQLGRVFSAAPHALVQRADQVGLPIIELRRRTQYIDVTEQVHAAIVNDQYSLLRRAEKIGHDLTELALAGVGPREVVRRLATAVGNPAVLEDPAHQVMVFSSLHSDIDEHLDDWANHSRSGHDQAAEASARCAWTSVQVRGEAWGRLHVLAVERPLDEITPLALERAAAALALTFHVQRDSAYLADHALGSLILDAIEGRCWRYDEILRRAKALGTDFDRCTLNAVVIDLTNLPRLAAAQTLSERARHDLRLTAIRHVRDTVRECGLRSLSAVHGDAINAFIGVPEGRDDRECLDEIGMSVSQRLDDQYPGLAPIVGISAIAGDNPARSFEQAREAIRYGSGVRQGSRVFHFGDVGLDGLLLRLAEGPALAQFVETELGPLMNRDLTRAVPLMPTLAEYLNQSGNKVHTAQALNIGRRSLYHRLDRISDLLGRDLDDSDVRMRLALALRGLNLLRARNPEVTTALSYLQR